MTHEAREVTVKFARSTINLPSSRIDFSSETIEATKSIELYFGGSVDFKPDFTFEYSGIIDFGSGEILKLDGMKMTDSCIGGYAFNVKSIKERKVMKTKGKQPRLVKVWRKI